MNFQNPAPNELLERRIGVVTSVKGSRVTLDLNRDRARLDLRATVGRFIAIRAGTVHLVGVVTELDSQMRDGSTEDLRARATVDLLGEIETAEGGRRQFKRGVPEYPGIGDAAELITSRDLRLVHEASARRTGIIGALQQDPTIPAMIDVDDLVSRHFAVLGATGVGKSSGVAVILDGILRARSDMRIFLLDVHNEYARCFGNRANVMGPRNLRLPFWMLNFEEIVDVIYGGRPAVADEIEILAELIPLAKATYGQYKTSGDRTMVRRADPKASGFTVDTPVPYLMQDLLALIDDRMGRLENRSSRMNYHRLMSRIEIIKNDVRYAFMFENANVGGDVMGEIVSQLFRVRPEGKPITVMQLGGLPSEALDAIVCVLCRLAFEFGVWSEGAVPLLFVCEEAHRYASANAAIGFGSTRRALSRIAKEGRKNGVFLSLVTQRPAELDPTIISQCGTLFAMRMANEHDQALLRSAVSDGAANLLAFVPSLGTREAIGFGEGVPLPARMTFSELPPENLPRSEMGGQDDLEDGTTQADFMQRVIERWRGAALGGKGKQEEEREPRPTLSTPLRAESSLEIARSRLLKRPLLDAADTPPAATALPSRDAGSYRF